MTVLLNPCYFGSISFWLGIISADEVIFEIWDNYQKQTLRSRCNILAANGKLNLTIPVNYTQKNRQLYKEVQIANNTNWRDLHLKSLDSAYKMSPYYEFYIDDIEKFYLNNWKGLMDFNFGSIQMILKLLDIRLKYRNSLYYIENTVGYKDLRFLSKKNILSPFKINSYTQVFTQKFGFTSDLSILDLLFNEGPNSENFLSKQLINQ